MAEENYTKQNYNRRTHGGNFPIVGKYITDLFPQLAAAQFEQVGRQTEAYRPLLQQAMQQAQANAFGGMQPLNAAIGKMYGAGAMTDLNAMQTPVISPEMLEVGSVDSILDPAEEAVAESNPKITNRLKRRERRRARREKRRKERGGWQQAIRGEGKWGDYYGQDND